MIEDGQFMCTQSQALDFTNTKLLLPSDYLNRRHFQDEFVSYKQYILGKVT